MTECEEIAENIWLSRSSYIGNGLNATMPIRTYADAHRIAVHQMPGESHIIINNVADCLYFLAVTRGVAK